MKILVYGAGAIGSYFAFRFSLGHDCIILTRGDHADVIKREGLVVKDIDGTQSGVELTALTRLEGLGEWKPDIVVISVKSHDTEEAIDNIMFHFEGTMTKPLTLHWLLTSVAVSATK